MRKRLLWIALLLPLLPTVSCRAQTDDPNLQTFMVPMRDGVQLSLVAAIPEGKGPCPVVLSRTPYGKHISTAEAQQYRKVGVVRAVQDLRGRFASQGQDLVFLTDAWGELQDGYDTIQWIAQQPWCNGKVGMIGGSAVGITQYGAAGAGPAALKVCMPTVAAPSLYHYAIYPGGAFRKADIESWWKGNKFRPEGLQQILAHPDYDALWQTADLIARAPQVHVPMMHIGGWYDMFSQGTLDAYTALQHKGGEGTRGNQMLVCGPWVHGLVPGGDLQFPPNALKNPGAPLTAAWLGKWLLGRPAPELGKPVYYYVMGACQEPGAPGNEWRNVDDWPIPATPTPLYLRQSGLAAFAAPQDPDATRSFRFDPKHPVPTLGGGNLTIKRGPADQRFAEDREDVLVFSTDPLEKPLEVTGQVFARLFVSSDCPDTDFTAKLSDVYPDGRSMLLCDGILRMRFRNGFAKEELMEPGKVYEVKVDLWSTSIIFNTGHRIRVAISSSNAPRFEPNPNTGAAFRANDEQRVAKNTVYLDTPRPSQVILPLPGGLAP